MEETKVEPISTEARCRALKYQEKIKKETKNMILKECRREMESEEWENTRWGREMKNMQREGGLNGWEREAAEDKGEDTIGRWRKTYKEKKDQERWKKIKDSRSAKDYQRWMIENRPKYLEMKGKKNKVKTIARFRCCNEWRGERYWEREEMKICRVCGYKEETWNHIKEECSTRTDLTDGDIMLRDGEGPAWMKRVYEKREEKRNKEDN